MTKTVKLSRSYTIGSETFSEVHLREPKFGDLLGLGEPFDVQKGIVVEYRETVNAYVNRLVTLPMAASAVEQVDLVDGIAIKEAVIGFFLDARRSRAKATSSSGASVGAPPTSPT